MKSSGKRPGRSPRAEVASDQVTIRVTEAERAAWMRSSHGKSLAEWIHAKLPGKRLGRPPRAGVASGQVTIRVTDAERAAWKRAAGGKTLAEWIRDTCAARIAAASGKK